MPVLLLFVFTMAYSYADCDLVPLKETIISQYKTIVPVTNEKGEIGAARGENFKVSESLVKVDRESLLIANFDLDIRWLSGKKQKVKTLVIGSVNPKTCQIENYKAGEKKLATLRP
jgi:hypothetical protein